MCNGGGETPEKLEISQSYSLDAKGGSFIVPTLLEMRLSVSLSRGAI
jgi:hypothetical protein